MDVPMTATLSRGHHPIFTAACEGKLTPGTSVDSLEPVINRHRQGRLRRHLQQGVSLSPPLPVRVNINELKEMPVIKSSGMK